MVACSEQRNILYSSNFLVQPGKKRESCSATGRYSFAEIFGLPRSLIEWQLADASVTKGILAAAEPKCQPGQNTKRNFPLNINII